MSLEKIEARDHAAEALDAGALAKRLLAELDYPPSATTVDAGDVGEIVLRARNAGRLLAMAEVAEDQACRVCGCTQFNACDGGCWWVETDLCSTCADANP